MGDKNCSICNKEQSSVACIDCYLTQVDLWSFDNQIKSVLKEHIMKNLRSNLELKGHKENCNVCMESKSIACNSCFLRTFERVLNGITPESIEMDGFCKLFEYNCSKYALIH